MDKKLWGSLIHLGRKKTGGEIRTKMYFDEHVWDDIVEATEKNGQNAILLDLGQGIHYGSHPELAFPDAWTRQRVRKEIKRLKEKGITLIPKLNFSSCHDEWLGEYGNMLSTPAYYRACRELIKEVSALFDYPTYFHVGMDEEDARHASADNLGIFRKGELMWHDMQFLLDCVRDCNLTPIIWGNYYTYEEFKANISPEDLVIHHWYYHSVKKEHWTRTDSTEEYRDYYSNGPYRDMHIEYVEEDPFYVAFRENAFRSIEDGYDAMIAVSSFYDNEYNTDEVIELFCKEVPEQRMKGYFTVPWKATVPENRERIIEAIHSLSQALEKHGK